MQMPDVNVLLYAFDSASTYHASALEYLESARHSAEPFGIYYGVLTSFIRLTMNPHATRAPLASIDKALDFCRGLLDSPNAVPVTPGPRHWETFERLCHARPLPYRVIPDAYFAAVAIDAGCEWVTFDRDFALFAGLRWRLLTTGQSFTNPT